MNTGPYISLVIIAEGTSQKKIVKNLSTPSPFSIDHWGEWSNKKMSTCAVKTG